MSLDQASFRTALDARLGDWRSRSFCVALSGGLDSMVLLELMAAAGPAGLRAMHVDHALHPASAAWAEFAGRRCGAMGVGFSAVTVNAPEPRG